MCMDNLGNFSAVINNLDSELNYVLYVWKDETAETYASLNDNIVKFVAEINVHRENAKAGLEAVKANYKEEEISTELSKLASRVMAV